MKLRLKTILIIGILFLITMLIGTIYTRTIFIQGYLNIERQQISETVQRLHYILEHEINTLGSLTNDWAAWDDSYAFTLNPGEDFIESNLVDDTFSELGLNFMIFLDDEGNSIFQKSFDLEENHEIPLDNSILSIIVDLTKTPPVNKTVGYHQGVFSNNGVPVIFAARPILKSSDEGPSRGLLIFGKFLQGDFFDHIQLSVNTELAILPYSAEKFFLYPPSPQNPEIRINLSQPEKAKFLSLVRDPAKHPVFIFEQYVPRTIYQQGLKSGRELLGSLSIGSSIASLVAMLALEFGFLRRISRLMAGVEKFKTQNHTRSEMVLKGKDELSSLSEELHKTLSLLAETQKELAMRFDFEKLLVSISTKFINLPVEEIDEGITRLLKVIGEFSNVDRTSILLLGEIDQGILDTTYEWHADGVPPVKVERQGISTGKLGSWYGSLKKGQAITFEDAAQIPDKTKTGLKVFLTTAVQSLAFLPIFIGGKLVGVMELESISHKTEWGEQTILLLEVIASVIASALDRSQHERILVSNQHHLANLNEITQASIGKATIDSACRLISSNLGRLINSDTAFLFIKEEKKGVKGYRDGRKFLLNSDRLELLSQLLDSPDPQIITPEMISDPEIQNAFVKTFGESALLLPLAVSNTKLGIAVFSFGKSHAFTKEEILFCQQSASQITLSIMKTIALESARRKSNELDALRATIADITSELDLSKLLHTLLERAIRLTNAEGGDLCKVDENTGDLEVMACINIEKEYVGTRISYGEGASGKVLASKKVLFLDDYSSWEGRLDIFPDSNIRSTVVLPLMIGERVLGTLGVFHINPDNHFSTEDQHMLSLFAQHATIAMQNALLFEKVQKMARIDDVTGLYNRRAFKEMGEYEIARANRREHPVSLAMIDLDNFKQINDRFSHQVGDDVLREFARICRESLRNIDLMGRYGGDEAVILMPETDAEAALIAMERLRKIVESTAITIRERTFFITTSIGIASFEKDSPSLSEIMDQADKCLYTAKKEGKNCVRTNK